MDKPELTKLNPPERSRTYVFPNGKYTINNVTAVGVRPSGTHRVEDANGRKYVIPPGWMAVELDVDDWTF